MKVHIVSDNKLVQVNNENGMRKLEKIEELKKNEEELRERKVGGERLEEVGGRAGGRKNGKTSDLCGLQKKRKKT